jgi:hypothetical protein
LPTRFARSAHCTRTAYIFAMRLVPHWQYGNVIGWPGDQLDSNGSEDRTRSRREPCGFRPCLCDPIDGRSIPGDLCLVQHWHIEKPQYCAAGIHQGSREVDG